MNPACAFVPIPAPLLAAGPIAWANPWLLAGLSLGLLPILIHLIFRRPYRDVPWGAMRFLKRALEKNSRRYPLDEWLLLLARIFAIVGIASAFAHPFRPSAATVERVARNHMIVVDASLSMQRVVDGKTLFSNMIDRSRQVLSQSSPGDSYQLLVVNGANPTSIVATPTVRADLIRQELDRLEPADSFASWPACLASIENAIPAGGNTDVWLMTDLQRTSWSSHNLTLDDIRSRIQAIADRASLHFPVNLQPSPPGNISLDSIAVRDRWILRSIPATLALTAHNWGDSTVTRTVVWTVDGLPAGREDVLLAPHETTSLTLHWQPARVGSHRIEARLIPADSSPGDFTADDIRRAVAIVHDEIPVLLIDGKSAESSFGNATDYLRYALQPNDSATTPGIRPRVMRDGSWLEEDLSRYIAVFACNVSHWTPAEATALANAVRQGTGLIFSLGDQVQPDIWQKTLGSDPPAGVDLLPARFAETVTISPEKYGVGFDLSRLKHPLVHIFDGVHQSGLEVTRTFQYQRLKLSETPALPREQSAGQGRDRTHPSNSQPENAEVALWFDNGDPAIVTRPFGRGCVILLASSLDRQGGTLAVFGHVLIPLVHEMLACSAQSRLSPPEFIAGNLPDQLLDTSTRDLDRTRAAAVQFRNKTGFCELSDPVGVIAVNHDPRESDLSQISATSLFDQSTQQKSESSRLPETIESPKPEFRWSAALLTLVLGLCVAEPWIADRSRWSLAFLFAASALATVWILFS